MIHKLSPDQLAAKKAQHRTFLGARRHPIIVALDNIRSLYNVGSIFRTSDAARIEKLYLCGFTACPPRKEIEKTALGATQTVPWEYRKDPVELIQEFKSKNISVCVLEHTTESIPYTSISTAQFPLCLVVGNELVGVSRNIVERADTAIEIPMYGMKQSLNVAVAYGIAVFEFVRILRQPHERSRTSQP